VITHGGLAEVGRVCNYLIDRRNKKLGIDCSNVNLCKLDIPSMNENVQ
jgi:hypothetical protein